MKGTGPLQRVCHNTSTVPQHLAGDPFDALCHFGSGAAGKCHQQNASGVGTVDDQMGNPMG